MIQINTFDPFKNWTRSSYEFLDEKLVLHSRSTKADYQLEVNYKDIKVIETRFITNRIANMPGLYLVIILLTINNFFEGAIAANPFLHLALKAGLILGIFAALFIFYVEEIYGFLDKDRNYLTFISVNNKNSQLVEQAIHLIREKTELFSETYLENPVEGDPVLHTFTSWDIPDSLNKSVTNFYKDRLVDSEKGLTEEVVREINYTELNGKTQVTRSVNEKWGCVANYWLWFCIMFFSIIIIFFPETFNHSTIPQIFLFIGAAVLIWLLVYFMKFVKQDVILFYNNNQQVIYWNWLNSRNREEMKQIVAFIQQKTGYNPEQP